MPKLPDETMDAMCCRTSSSVKLTAGPTFSSEKKVRLGNIDGARFVRVSYLLDAQTSVKQNIV